MAGAWIFPRCDLCDARVDLFPPGCAAGKIRYARSAARSDDKVDHAIPIPLIFIVNYYEHMLSEHLHCSECGTIDPPHDVDNVTHCCMAFVCAGQDQSWYKNGVMKMACCFADLTELVGEDEVSHYTLS